MICPFAVEYQPWGLDCGAVLAIAVVPDTVGVAVAEDVVRQLVYVLQSFHLDNVGIEMGEANVEANTRTADAEFDHRLPGLGVSFNHVYSAFPLSGTSVGPACGNTSGTLGFFLKVDSLGCGHQEQETMFLAVTCHHVIDPEHDLALAYPSPTVKVMSPSDNDHATWVQRLACTTLPSSLIPPFPGQAPATFPNYGTAAFQSLLSGPSDIQLEIAEKLDRCLGSVIVSSGQPEICPQRKCRLDWAAIDVTHAAGLKKTGHHVLTNSPSQSLQEHLRFMKYDVNWGIALQCVASLSRTTGPTIGLLYGCVAVTRTYGNTTVESREQIILPFPGEDLFAKPGDSGALVYGPTGQGLGMVWGGITKTKATKFAFEVPTFVTPLESIMQDITMKFEQKLGKGNVLLTWLS